MDSEMGKIKLELRQKIAIYNGTCQGTLNMRVAFYSFVSSNLYKKDTLFS